MSLETADPHGTYTFEFRVTGEEIRVVEYPPEFAELLKYNTGPTRNLLAAIKFFDMSQDLEVPISEIQTESESLRRLVRLAGLLKLPLDRLSSPSSRPNWPVGRGTIDGGGDRPRY